jgi:hypothetical protein
MPFIKITVTVPKEIINTERVRQAIESKMRAKTGPDLKTAFRLVTLTWQHSPDYQATYEFGSSRLATTVMPIGPNAKIFALVSNGAAPHDIYPRRANVLSFRSGYRPKSRPRYLKSVVGGKFGNFVHRHFVRHHGFEAREFPETIADVYESIFRRDMRDAIRDGTKK